MSDQTFRLSFSRTVRLILTTAAMAILGGFAFYQTKVDADENVTYTLQAVDVNGNPIDSTFNAQELTFPVASNFIDVSSKVPLTMDNGRYVIKGYYTDNKSEQQIMYYYELNQKTDKDKMDHLQKLAVYNPHRAADDFKVNIYFAYQDTQQPKPEKIKLTDDAKVKEPGKVKIFYTDVNGHELKPSVKYDYDTMPDPDPSFERQFDGYRYVAAVIRNRDNYGTYVYSDSKIFANMQTDVDDLLFQAVLQPRYILSVAMRPKQHRAGSTATFVYEKYAANLTIDYVDESGNPIDGYPAQKQQLDLNSEYSEEAPDIPGYTLVGDKKVTGKVTDDFKITFKYKKTIVPPTPYDKGDKSNNHGNSNDSTTNSNNNKKDSTPVTPTFPDRKTLPDGTQLPNYAATEGTAVYATKKIYMYQRANFKKGDRIVTYPKAKRINRPMFVVTDYARSNGGALRYKVKDVNHHSKTSGKVGYITANRKFVVKVYYSTMPKNNKITVISKKGVNAYKHANLTKKVKNYKKGTHLKVKKIVKHNLTTRYQLSNGYYITANKKLIIHGNY